MECVHCGAIWEVAPHFDYPNRCPFCGTYISKDDQSTIWILKRILDTNGLEILKDGKKLSQVIKNLMEPGEERTAICLAAREGIGGFFLQALKCDDVERKIQMNMAYQLVMDDLEINKEDAQQILNSFGFALGLSTPEFPRNYHDSDDSCGKLQR